MPVMIPSLMNRGVELLSKFRRKLEMEVGVRMSCLCALAACEGLIVTLSLAIISRIVW